jgi:hypothetical protein
LAERRRQKICFAFILADVMVKDGKRFCDICAEEIPKGDAYRRSHMPAGAAALFASIRDPDLIPTWTTNRDGTISLDACTTCALAMGNFNSPGKDEIN